MYIDTDALTKAYIIGFFLWAITHNWLNLWMQGWLLHEKAKALVRELLEMASNGDADARQALRSMFISSLFVGIPLWPLDLLTSVVLWTFGKGSYWRMKRRLRRYHPSFVETLERREALDQINFDSN